MRLEYTVKTKGKRKSIEKRRIRRIEKRSDVLFDVMLGKASRRGWGKGIAA